MAFLFNLLSKRPAASERVPTDTIIPLFDRDDNAINKAISLDFTMVFDAVMAAEKISGALWKLLDRPGLKKLGARLRLNVRRRNSCMFLD
jgi:hypothetical protein